MRKLSPTFMGTLTNGFLSPIREKAAFDVDLDLQIRANYLNIYYKGNSLLNLRESKPGVYRTLVHEKFLRGCSIPEVLVDERTTLIFSQTIPYLKENILKYGRSSIETEYEQMIIRANNDEPRNNCEYFITDRQYAGPSGRFDLTGFFWSRNKRRKGDVVFPCLIEIKYGLNQDIREVHDQLEGYYHFIDCNPEAFAIEAETVFKQKLELGLFHRQPKGRLAAMKTLVFSTDLSQFQFIVILVDYNPHSGLHDLAALAKLPFAGQVRVWQTGFGMWAEKLKPLCIDASL
jgi:hypothetical protein